MTIRNLLGLCSDTDLRVYNISNVQVSDANLSATVFAVAERLAAILKKEYADASM